MVIMIAMFIALVLIAIIIGLPVGIVLLIVWLTESEKRRTAQNAGVQPNAEAPSGQQITEVRSEASQGTEFTEQVQQPVYAEPKAPRRKMSASAIMMLIGTAFIILSVITFVAANWVSMSPEGRVFALAGAGVLAFTVSAVMKAAVKLEGTSIAFYTIGSFVFTSTLITAARYELFGSWFSTGGGGFALLWACAAFLLAAASFIAFPIYKKGFFNYFGFVFSAFILLFGSIQLTDTIDQFSMLIILVQAVITAALHLLKPQKDTIMEKPARIIGDITAVFFAIFAFTYVLFTTISPTSFTFIVLAVILAQLLLYGIFKKQRWMFVFFNLTSLYTAFTLCTMLEENYGEDLVMLLFSFITLIVYVINLVLPKNMAASKIVTMIAAIIGAFVSLFADNDNYYGVNIIVPLAVSAIITAYVFHKNKGIQCAAGVFAPFMPFFAAIFLNNRLNLDLVDVKSRYVMAFTFGGLVLLYLAVSVLLLALPKLAFGFHAKHPMQTHTIIYANMIASAAILVNISGYSPIYIVIAALCIMQFAISHMLRCNVTAVGSVISLIVLVSNVIEHYIPKNDYIVIYSMFALFVLMVLASRLIFRDGLTYKQADGKLRIDIVLLSSWIAVFTYPGIRRTTAFMVFVSIAVFLAGFIKRKTNSDAAAIILSFSAVFAAFAALSRPFLTPDSALISNKITLGIFVLLGVAYKYIWKNHKTGSKIVSTAIFILSFAGLITDGIVNDEVINRIFVLAVTAAILILSFYTKSKTWFIASSTALVIITVFSSRQYFDKMGWWLYLFIVGIVLVVIAAVNEACKKKGETMKSTVTKKFSDWTW